MKVPRVSIIILVYKGWRDALELLDSLKKLDYGNFEIILVDNASPDGSGKILKERLGNIRAKMPHISISLIQSKENKGFSGGNNLGIRFAIKRGADYFWLLNPDTIVHRDSLRELVDYAEKSDKAGILGPWICYYTGKDKLWFAGGKINWLRTKGLHWGNHISLTSEMKKGFPYEVDYITGAAPLIKKEVLDKVGFMNKDYFLYYEDVDYGLRAKEAGFKNIVVPQAKIWHKTSSSTGLYSPLYIYYMTRSGFMFAWKHSGWFRRFFIVIPLVKLKFLKQILKLIFGSAEKKRWARWITRGIWDFWLGRQGKTPYFD